MKREIARYVFECDICKRVKASHLRSAGPLQPLSIPSWKWEDISMDFIVGLPKTLKGYDSIWVIVDRLTKSAHFLAVKNIYRAQQYAELYISRILSLHGVPRTIISDRGAQFVARFWEQLHSALGTQPITLRQMVRQKESIKFWRICSEHARSPTARNGMNVYLKLSLPITIAITRASEWLLLRHCMGKGVEPQ